MAKMTLEDLAEISELLKQAEFLRPLVKEAIDTIKSFEPEITEVLGGISNFMVDMKIDQVKRFEAAGFPRDEAIVLSTDVSKSVQNALNTKKEK